MTLQEIITKITEAEASLSKELERDNLDIAQEYLNYTQELLKELVELKDKLSPDEVKTAREFAEAYAAHIKEQVKVLAVEQAKIGEEYKKTKMKHRVSDKYKQINKMYK